MELSDKRSALLRHMLLFYTQQDVLECWWWDQTKMADIVQMTL